MGTHKNKNLHILMDTGSTHNFLDVGIAKALGCILTPISPVWIEAVGENHICCSTICKQFEWEIQGEIFKTDLYVIPLGATEMVLGIQWISALGDII